MVSEAVLAIPCWAVFASFDAHAPQTADLFYCATQELAGEAVAELNRDPRRFSNLAFVDGFEWAKRFEIRRALLDTGLSGVIATTLFEALAAATTGQADECGADCAMEHVHCESCGAIVEEDAPYTDPALCKPCQAKFATDE